MDAGGRRQEEYLFEDAYRFQFFVPRQFNPDAFQRRDPIPQAKFERLHERLLDEFPGLTYSEAKPPLGQGLWYGDASGILSDECYLYDIVANRDNRHRAFFIDLLGEFLRPAEEVELGLDQKAALLLVTEVEKLYLERPLQSMPDNAGELR